MPDIVILDDLPSSRTVIFDGTKNSWERAKINATAGVAGLAAVTGASVLGWLWGAIVGRSIVTSAGPAIASGAGGAWAAIGEKVGGAVAQITNLSCGAACGTMLTGISQSRLILTAGAPTHAALLAKALGTGWRGGYVGPTQLQRLAGLGRSFIAELYDGMSSMGHFVVVDRITRAQVFIRDPWNGGSTYRMMLSEFLRVWTGNAVFK
jgi:hypothetical protein